MIPLKSDLWFCLASGPSLTVEDVQLVRAFTQETGRGKVIVTNNTVFKAPWADVLYAADTNWWRTYSKQISWFKGRRCSIAPATYYDVDVIPSKKGEGIADHFIRIGLLSTRNSGAQSIGLAHLWGGRTIVLLGHDGKIAEDGRRHHHEDHPAPMGNAGAVEKWREGYDLLLSDLERRGTRCINCSRDTAHNWPRMPLEQFLEEVRGKG